MAYFGSPSFFAPSFVGAAPFVQPTFVAPPVTVAPVISPVVHQTVVQPYPVVETVVTPIYQPVEVPSPIHTWQVVARTRDQRRNFHANRALQSVQDVSGHTLPANAIDALRAAGIRNPVQFV
eukprot:TRINITY_DN14305_c0_g1_i1.p2 TRINITY_DN14305_c0_g1~~TRINITY_DN14305_c0_g1_i1.p2  ORF type:complete len:122 (+),score=16.37 TRINITY_DN14305_c0_g1_i1:656-1021(+)